MSLIGFTATVFLLSLGTYPVVEARIGSLPYPAIVLVFVLGLLLLNGLAGYRAVLSNLDKSIIAASTFLAYWLFLVTAVSSFVLGHSLDNQRYVGIGYILVYPAIALAFRHVEVRWLLWTLLGGCVLAISIGYGRYFTLSGGTLSEHTLGYWGIKYLPSTRNSDVLYAMVSSLVATGLYAFARTRLIRLVLIFIVIASFSAVILSLSRSAWIALSTGYAALLWFTRKHSVGVRRRAQTIGVIVFLSLVVATTFNSKAVDFHYDLIVDRMLSIVDNADPAASNQERLDLARDAVTGILRHPAGVGVGNAAYALGYPLHSVGHAENAWLTLGLEGGWLAIAAFTSVLVWLLHSTKPPGSTQAAGRADASAAIGMALLVSTCTYLLFNHELNSLFLWSVLAVVWAIKRRKSIATDRHDFSTDGGVQWPEHNRRGVALDSGANTSSG